MTTNTDPHRVMTKESFFSTLNKSYDPGSIFDGIHYSSLHPSAVDINGPSPSVRLSIMTSILTSIESLDTQSPFRAFLFFAMSMTVDGNKYKQILLLTEIHYLRYSNP